MAYVPEKKDEKDQEGMGSTPPGAFGDTTPSSTPTKTGFVNVMDYLTKNPQASGQLGDAAAGKLNQQRTEAEGALSDTQSKFGQDVQGGSTTLDQGLLDRAFADPSKFAGNPGDLAKFTAMRDASYKGPESLQATDYFSPAQSKMTGLQTTAEGLGNEAGRSSLVEGLSDHPTHGKTALNQLLLQGNDEAAQKVQQAAGSFKGVEDQWQQFMQAAPGQVEQAKAGTNAAKTATNMGLNDATSTFMKQLQDQTTKATSDRDAFNLNYQNTQKGISDGGAGLTQQQLADLGISDAAPYLQKLNSFNTNRGLNYYGSPVQLSNFETNPGSANTNIPTMASTANADQYAREAALQQMSGMDLGLPDQQENPYVANGKMPTLDYMGAFNKAGTDLKNFDSTWQPKVAGYGPDDVTQLQTIQGRSELNSPGYYTNPTAGAAAPAGFGVTPPPAGWDNSQPVPHPAPTSNPPSNLVNPQWNPYTGQWEGAQLQPNNPPPDSGGGHHTF